MKISDIQEKKITESLEKIMSRSVELYPYKEAMYITVWYIILGGMWILFSDTLLNFFVKDPNKIQMIQFIKGWLYVAITGIYIYILIYFRVKMLKRAIDEVQEGYIEIASMAEEIIEKENEIFELSHYDRITGLFNWTGLSIAFNQLIKKNIGGQYVLMYIDIDNIKHINDTLGHEHGNMLLSIVANKLKGNCVKDEIISRISGDEFILVMKYSGNKEKLNKDALEINEFIRTTWNVDEYEFYITASMGVAIYPEHGEDLDTLIKHADTAMFMAKDNGKDQHFLYNELISKKTQNYIEVISQIRHGIIKNEFELYYQPIVSMKSGELVAVEALIRWNHPKRGFLTPYHFIEIAEESGQINKIGKWVFDTACRQYKAWVDAGYNPMKISINLSGRRMFDENLLEDMKQSMAENNVHPKWLQIEITETAVIKNLNEAIKILEAIRALGISIALDDFGTGYSSLTHLQIFPIDVLKIDKEFIKNISVEGMEKENNIINAVINLAHSLELEIVAEGIEEREQAEYLLVNNCDCGQGYYYDRPIPIEELNKKYFQNKIVD